MNDIKIGFIGTGQMATALAAGFCQSGQVLPENIFGYDIQPESLARFSSRVPGCIQAQSNLDVVNNSDLIVLAVKPQIIPSVAPEIKTKDPNKVFVSVIGGITIEWLAQNLGTEQVIRTMPNTPCLIGKGATGISSHEAVSPELVASVVNLFQSVGIAFELPERLIDAVTGISGSGPAFVFQFIEALSDGAVNVGIPRDIALQLAAQTVMGAGSMVIESGEHPAVLKDKVASPGGTTIAGLAALEQGGLRAATINAVVAATERSIELGS